MHDGFQGDFRHCSPAFGRFGCRGCRFDARVAAVQHCAGFVGEDGEGGAGVGFLRGGRDGGAVPGEVLGVVEP